MLLGLPSHLGPQSSGRAIARACHAVATVLLVAAAVILISAQVTEPSLVLWPAIAALVPMAGLVVLVERVRSTASTVVYLLGGGAAVYVYSLTALTQVSWINSSDAFTVSLPKLVLVLVGGSGLRASRGPLWATFGLLVGEAADQLATVQAGATPRLDATTLLGYVLVVVSMGGALVARDRAKRMLPNLHRAARDEQVSGLRHELGQQASAMVHDTVLSHLAAVALGPTGRLDPALADAMARDLDTIVGQEWLRDEGAEAETSQVTWESSGLYRTVEEARRQGLDVAVTGDLSAVGRVSGRASRALSQAVGQCLVNVLKHSGTTSAEVVLLSSDADVSVMVIDNGRGFDESATPRDRLGLKNSVRGRIEGVGGSVQVWSSPGRGTSIMIGLPLGGEAVDGGRPRAVDSSDDDARSFVEPEDAA